MWGWILASAWEEFWKMVAPVVAAVAAGFGAWWAQKAAKHARQVNKAVNEKGKDEPTIYELARTAVDGMFDNRHRLDRIDIRNAEERALNDRRHGEIMRYLGGHDTRLGHLESDEYDRWRHIGVEPLEEESRNRRGRDES